MPKKLYVGIDNVARKVKKQYIGIDNVARSVKKAYVGIDGVARKYWPSGLSYYTKMTLSQSTHYEAATIGNHAIFAPDGYTTVDAFDYSLTKTFPTQLSRNPVSESATETDDYAFFFGGINNVNATAVAYVHTYDRSLTYRRAPNAQNRQGSAACSIGQYALFGGGMLWSDHSNVNTVDAYNASLTKSNPTPFTNNTYMRGSARAGSYAVFAGGSPPTSVNILTDAYDASLTKTALSTHIGRYRYYLGCASIGQYALFGGGYDTVSQTAVSARVDVYDASLTLLSATPLSVARFNPAATTVGKNCMFAGGSKNTSSSSTTVVDLYDDNLVLTQAPPISTARANIAATALGKYALFGGGTFSNSNILDVYVDEDL